MLHIKPGAAASAAEERKALIMFKEVLSGLFKFRIEFFQFIDRLCFLRGLDATSKLIVRVLLVPYVLLQFGLVYLVYSWCEGRRRGRKEGYDLISAASPEGDTSMGNGNSYTGTQNGSAKGVRSPTLNNGINGFNGGSVYTQRHPSLRGSGVG